ncbi:MAG: winged helix-turn-helix transcriptional regulator [Theionarchaea archaeon]|nr:winged helix-turn-helix transcriptional regulator [Theionarchaea archaeon]
MIDKLPKCLQTCLNCGHAVIYEEYSDTSRSIVFGGCWKIEGIKKPVDRGKCQRFKENPERVKRSFWKKWEGRIYIDYKENPFRYDQEERINYEAFETADTLLSAEDGKPAGEHEEISREDEQAQDPKLIITKHGGPPEGHEDLGESGVTAAEHEESPQDNNVIAAECEESPPEHEEITKDRKETDRKNVTRVAKTDVQKNTTTRSLILQALANNIFRLKDIAHFAEVDRSTAHYHLRNLIKEERATKVSWGHYAFSDKNFLDHGGETFEKLLKNFSHLGRCTRGRSGLHPVEKNILMDILSKDNKYERFSERELARKNNISRYMVKKYTEKLEKKKLIIIKREKNQLVFVPTELAVNGLTTFFEVVKSGSKIGKESSKIQPIYQPVENSYQPPDGLHDSDQETDPLDVLETFDDYIAWQQKNAHRMIIQFKLLKCNHDRLKGTGWIFDKKRIHRHFTEAYIFKSKDPTGHFVNVLPKHPFIFTSPFEFEDKIVAFVNEVIDRLRDYQMIVDLSEPAEIRLQHEAIEDDPFSRKVIKKGLLYFESKVVTVDQTGELIKYVMKIDKSKSLHFEFEGPEAHLLTEKVEAFVDDIITGKIDRKKLREVPQKVEMLKKELGREIQHIEDRLDTSVKDIHDAQRLLAENQIKLSEDLVSCMEVITKIGEACESMARAAHTIMRDVELLTAGTQVESSGCSYLSSCS